MKRKGERGFVLVVVLVIALLYFALMELVLIESAEALRSAQRFRSGIVAGVVAENGIELAMRNAVVDGPRPIEAEIEGGRVSVTARSLPGNRFELRSSAAGKGVAPSRARVELAGRIAGTRVQISSTKHD